MVSADFEIRVTYHGIGYHHLLVHFCGCKVDHWMLLDLAEISSRTGKSYDEIIQKLREG